jgi:hypothetical protein
MFASRLAPHGSRLTNHSIRSRQHVRRNRQTDLFGGFQVDDEFEFRWLLHWEVGGFGTFWDLVDVDGRALTLPALV